MDRALAVAAVPHSFSCHNRSAVFPYRLQGGTSAMGRAHASLYGVVRGISIGWSTALVLALAGCGGSVPDRPMAKGHGPHFKIGYPYKINGQWYYPEFVTDYEAIGVASWYGDAYHGRPTANGEVYDMYALTAAHPTLQLPSVVEVMNLENGRSLVLRVNDRGPFVQNRLIDLSYAAARALGFERQGLAQVQVRYLGLARLDEPPIRPGEDRQYATLSCELPRPERLVC
jgi:rare lipoprotein A